MATPYLGEIRLCSFNFAPRNWALCNGQLLSIAQNTALFSLLGTVYGGNGVQTFALPDLRGRRPLGMGNSNPVGEQSGTETHTLAFAELAAHTHPLAASNVVGSSPTLQNAYLAASAVDAPYADTTLVGVNTDMVVPNSTGSLSHENLPPYLVMNFVIALTGNFPSRN